MPGHGSELGETRAYQLGDDVRRIDWNVSARLQNTYIRQTIAERELESWLIVDTGARMDFGTALCTKRDLALSAAAAVGFLTSRDGNRLGAILAAPDGATVVPARGTKKHTLRLLSQIHEAPHANAGGVTDLTGALKRLSGVARRRGLVAVISDFRVDEGWLDAIRIVAKRHDVLAIEVVDPLERRLPNVGLISIVDPATGSYSEVATHKAKVRDIYAAAADQRAASIASEFRAARIDHLVLHTDRPWLDDLVAFVAARRHRLTAQLGGI
ncbi:MAG: DUF58 domain-containing protein [Acidimicrobiales bacterium]